MIAARLDSILIISNERPAWLGGNILDYYRVDVQPYFAAEQERALERYKLLIVVDDVSRSNNALWQIEALRASEPEKPIWFIASQLKVGDYRRLSELKVMNVLPYEITLHDFSEQLNAHFQLSAPTTGIPLERFEYVAHYLQAIHSLASRSDFVPEFLDGLCNNFNLYGATALVKEDSFKMYSVRGGADKGRTHIARHSGQNTDLLMSVMLNRETKQLGDINHANNYVPIPVLPEVERALLLPLTYHGKAFGALALFSRRGQVFTQPDIHIFSMIAAHFSVAYHLIHRYENESVGLRYSNLLVAAWEQLNNSESYEELARGLYALVMELPYIEQALIWLPTLALPDMERDIVISGSETIIQSFQRAIDSRELTRVVEHLFQTLTPYTLAQQQAPGIHTVRFMNVLGSGYAVFIPIFTATSVEGFLIISVAMGSSVDDSDLNSLERLLTVAGQGLERITYLKHTGDKQTYLESVLQAITEGVFFLNRDNDVVFTNSQFTELTGIPQDDIINQSGGVLLRRLAECDDNFKETLRQFMEALYGTAEEALRQRVILIRSRRMGYHLEVTLSPIDHPKGAQGAWLGIVRDIGSSATQVTSTTMFEQIANHVRMSYLEASTLLSNLSEQSGPIEHHTRQRMIGRLQHELEALEFGWEDMLRLREIENGRQLSLVKISPNDLMEKVLTQRLLARRRREFNVRISGGLPMLNADVQQLLWALARIFYTVTDEAPTMTQVRIETDRLGKTVRIVLNNELYTLPPEGHQLLFNTKEGKDNEPYPFQQFGTKYLGLYLARRILRLHNSDFEVQNFPGRGTELLVRLTCVAPEEEPILLPELVSGEVPYVAYPTPGRFVRGRVLMLAGKSQMAAQALLWLKPFFDVARVNTLDLALEQLEGAGPEIIIVDAALHDQVKSLDACRILREKTQVPIVMVTDYPTSDQKIAALESGVDVYIGNATSQEFLLEIDTVSKRGRVPERNQKEPLRLGDLIIDLTRREVFLSSTLLDLTRIEYDLLRMLAISPGNVVKHDELLTEVWGPECTGKKYRQYLWVNMSRLRKKLQPDELTDSYIQTRSGLGYFLQVPNRN